MELNEWVPLRSFRERNKERRLEKRNWVVGFVTVKEEKRDGCGLGK